MCLARLVLNVITARLRFLQWDKVENKTGVVLYGAGAFVLLWFSSTLVSALNAIPLVGDCAGVMGEDSGAGSLRACM